MLGLELRNYFRRQGALRRKDGLRPKVRRYLESFTLPPPQTPIDAVRYVVFDCETTGLDVRDDRLLSIGAVALRDGAVHIGDSFEAFVYREDVGGKDAAPIHGIVPQDLRAGGRGEDEVVDAFLEYAGGAILVGHHVAFDLAMLDASLRWTRQLPVLNASIDTEAFARRLDAGPMQNHSRGDLKRYRLDDLAERFEVPTIERHTAAGDALVTALVLQRLLLDARRRGIRTLGELL